MHVLPRMHKSWLDECCASIQAQERTSRQPACLVFQMSNELGNSIGVEEKEKFAKSGLSETFTLFYLFFRIFCASFTLPDIYFLSAPREGDKILHFANNWLNHSKIAKKWDKRRHKNTTQRRLKAAI